MINYNDYQEWFLKCLDYVPITVGDDLDIDWDLYKNFCWNEPFNNFVVVEVREQESDD